MTLKFQKWFIGVFLLLFSKIIFAQVSYMVKEFSHITESSNPEYFKTLDSLTYFIADDGIHGNELWITNGTKEGTSLLFDIIPGIESGFGDGYRRFNPQFNAIGNILYFIGKNTYESKDIWRTDGTSDGTYRVRWSMDYFGNIEVFNSELIFLEERRLRISSNNGAEFNDIVVTGTNGPAPFMHVKACRDFVFFVGWDFYHGYELWKTDGTTENTQLVKDINAGPYSLFEAIEDYPDFIASDSILFFICKTNEYGWEMWRSDGTEDGTFIVKDINPGIEDGIDLSHIHSSPIQYNNNSICFVGNDGQHGSELWTSDGTEEGTYMIKDINLFGSSNPNRFFIFNNELYFKIHSDGNSEEDFERSLWKTDGTSENTISFIPGSNYRDFEKIAVSDNYLYFTRGNNYDELWKMDTSYLISKIGEYNEIEMINAVQNSLYLSFNDSIYGNELWIIEESNTDHIFVDDINKVGNSNLSNLTATESALLLTGTDDEISHELWSSNGMEYFTKIITDIEYGDSYPKDLVRYKDKVYYIANCENYSDCLYKTDGTKDNTEAIFKASSIYSLKKAGEYLYFISTNGIWRSDGTADGTILIPNTNAYVYYDFYVLLNGLFVRNRLSWFYIDTLNNTVSDTLITPMFSIYDFFEYNEKVFFHVVDIDDNTFPETINSGFWSTDGTAEGTHLTVKFEILSDCIIYKDKLIISGILEAQDFGLYSSDGTNEGTFKIEEIPFEYQFSSINNLTIFKDTLYFTYGDYQIGKELYKTYAGENSAELVININTYGSDEISNLYVTDSNLYFSANDGVHGVEPWLTRGSESTTYMIEDINKNGSSNPSEFELMNGNLYYIANDFEHGKELWTTVYKSAFEVKSDTIIVRGRVHNNQLIKQIEYLNIPDTGVIKFIITSGNTESTFKIDSTGKLVISNKDYLNHSNQSIYKLNVVLNNGFMQDTAIVVVKTSIYEYTGPEKIISCDNTKDLNIFPNPVTSSLIIKSESELFYTIELISINGNQIFYEAFPTGTLKTEIALEDYQGLYFVRIYSEKRVINKKIIVSGF